MTAGHRFGSALRLSGAASCRVSRHVCQIGSACWLRRKPRDPIRTAIQALRFPGSPWTFPIPEGTKQSAASWQLPLLRVGPSHFVTPRSRADLNKSNSSVPRVFVFRVSCWPWPGCTGRWVLGSLSTATAKRQAASRVHANLQPDREPCNASQPHRLACPHASLGQPCRVTEALFPASPLPVPAAINGFFVAIAKWVKIC